MGGLWLIFIYRHSLASHRVTAKGGGLHNFLVLAGGAGSFYSGFGQDGEPQ